MASAKKTLDSSENAGFSREIIGLVIFGVIVFLFASLLSYTPTDPSLNHIGPGNARNWMGPLGAQMADILITGLGLASWLFIPILILFLISYIRGDILKRTNLHIATGSFFIFFSSLVLLGLIDPKSLYGGVIGAFLANSLKSFVGLGGTALIGIILFLAGLLLATPLTLKMIIFPFKRKKEGQLKEKRKILSKKKGSDVTTPEQEVQTPLIIEPKKTSKEETEPQADEDLKDFEITPVKGQFSLPPISFLQEPPEEEIVLDKEAFIENSKTLEQKLRDFGVQGRVVEICPGPVVTMYEFSPAPGVKINKVASLADDLALALKTRSVRIVAPIPGKAVIGIELANPKRQTVYLRQILESDVFKKGKGELLLALGQDIVGQAVVTDLSKMPHLLIAGATGTGKSVGLNAMICSLLYRLGPDRLRLLMIDPKRIELSLYDGIPHLIHPVVSEPKEATRALRWAVMEMERRYELLEDAHARNVLGYNEVAEEPLPYLVVIIDELADLMMVSSKEVEGYIARLAQMARAAGIHIIIATQRPSVDVLTGLIKANFPARISFKVSSKVDSRTILDTVGAERLLGNGDMLFLPPGSSNIERLHGAFISEPEIIRIVEFLKAQGEPEYDFSVVEPGPDETKDDQSGDGEFFDEKYDEAVEIVTSTGQASISGLQRRLRIGYNRAARLIEQMEREGIVTPTDSMGRRQVIVKGYDEI